MKTLLLIISITTITTIVLSQSKTGNKYQMIMGDKSFVSLEGNLKPSSQFWTVEEGYTFDSLGYWYFSSDTIYMPDFEKYGIQMDTIKVFVQYITNNLTVEAEVGYAIHIYKQNKVAWWLNSPAIFTEDWRWIKYPINYIRFEW